MVHKELVVKCQNLMSWLCVVHVLICVMCVCEAAMCIYRVSEKHDQYSVRICYVLTIKCDPVD